MEIKLLASTNVQPMSLEEATIFAGQMAGVCYLNNSMNYILEEDPEHTLKRAKMLLKSKHHSPFEHVTYTFLLEGIPKILAMILNNEKVYCTSEKSARYTKMKVNGPEAEFYNEWEHLISEEISKEYPDMPEKRRTTLARENARYGISIFSPATVMVHKIDLRQLNYILGYIEDYILNCKQTPFNDKLVPILREFYNQMQSFNIPELRENKGISLSLFSPRLRGRSFGEVYSYSYPGTFAQLAQAQRHRTLDYSIMLPKENAFSFYIPEIVKQHARLREKWESDLKSLAHLFPQGLLVTINERGTLENFVRKCYERLCGAAQLEIAEQTRDTLQHYHNNTKTSKPFIAKSLAPYLDRPRCKFGYKCTTPCFFGPDGAFSRKV